MRKSKHADNRYSTMKLVYGIIVFCLLLIFPAFGLDRTEWIKKTVREDNPMIIPFLTQDLDIAMEAVSALSLRDDPYIGDIIDYLRAHSPQKGSRQNIAALTRLLSVFLSRDLAQGRLAERIKVNQSELISLLSTLPVTEDLDLKMEIIRLMVLIRDAELFHLILEEGQRLVTILREKSGYLSQPEEKLLYIIIRAISDAGINEGRTVLSGIIHASRSILLVDAARKALYSL